MLMKLVSETFYTCKFSFGVFRCHYFCYCLFFYEYFSLF